MKWLALLGLLAAVPPSQQMEQKVYLPHCSGSWYVDSQGTDDTMDSVDWAVLKCTDYSEESSGKAPDFKR